MVSIVLDCQKKLWINNLNLLKSSDILTSKFYLKDVFLFKINYLK